MTLKLDLNERADSIPLWLKAFKADAQSLWQYPNRKRIEQLIAQTNTTTPSHVFVSNGGDEAIELLFKQCKLNQQSVLLPAPAFSQYSHQLKIWNIDNSAVAGLANLNIDVIGIKQHLKANQWLILTRPNNPTGECVSEQVLISLIECVKNRGGYVFLDEAYIEFYLENSGINYALEYDNVVVLRTFSKAFGLAGARIGYLMGNPQLINEFKRLAMPFNVNHISLQLAELALENSDEMRIYCKTIASNRDKLRDYLRSCSIDVYDGKGNFLLFKVKPKVKALLKSVLLKNRIAIKTQVNDLQEWVRITLPENCEPLLFAVKLVFEPEVIGFDMDGVLIDTSQSYDACIIKTVAYFTNNLIKAANISELREKGGFNNDWVLTQALINQAGFTQEYKITVAQFQYYYQQLKNNEIDLLQDRSLFSTDRYITAIVTGRPKEEALYGVQQLQINPDYIISADDVNQQKPSPEGLNDLQTKTNKSRLWYCGDTVDDMQAGLASNCVCIGIGKNSKTLCQAGADIVLENINQLSELL